MVQAVSNKISELDEIVSPSGDFYIPATVGGATYKVLISSFYGSVFDIRAYGATPKPAGAVSSAESLAQATRNVLAIQEAIDLASVAGGVVLFPGDTATRYPINGQLTVMASNVKLLAPGGAKLYVYSSIPVAIAVGDIEVGVDLTQGNTLASDVAAGALSIPLSAGKGTNVTAGTWLMVKSNAIIPGHHAAVVNKVAEFVRVFSIATDTLTLDGPLRFSYATADDAQVYVIDWVENFSIEGLGFDGNDQTSCAIALQLSWCLSPTVSGSSAEDLEQRFVRFQGCLQHRASGIRQHNGLSTGFVGSGFSYVTAEQGLCQDGIIDGVQAYSCRHAYTTGAGWTDNNGTTSAVITGIGVPMDTLVCDGVHHNSRGAGWDTHEVGLGITWRNLKTIGSSQIGFQVRSVNTKVIDCFARDCIGAVIQVGADAIGTVVRGLTYENTNLGTDTATSTDWTKVSKVQDNSPDANFGPEAPNELDNGSFEIWDRAASFTANGGTANRWHLTLGTGASVTVTRRATDPVAEPHPGKYYLRFDRTVAGSSASFLGQRIDDVRSFAGKRLQLSFRMRDSLGGTDINWVARQYFGTGGSPSADVDTTSQTLTIDGSWRWYNVSIDVPTLTGKTIGSDEVSAFILLLQLPSAAGVTQLDIDNVKLEVGEMPTSYLAKSPAAERSACARWFQMSYRENSFPGDATSIGAVTMVAPVASTLYARQWVTYGERMGRIPTVVFYSTDGTINTIRNTVTGPGNNAAAVTPASGPGITGFYGGATGGTVNVGDVFQGHWTASVAGFE